MIDSDQLERLKYQQEVLRARYEIRERYLSTFVREVYENIGQILSLAGMEIGMLQEEGSVGGKERAGRIGALVRQAIHDLRFLSGSLYSEITGFKVDDIAKALSQEASLLNLPKPEFIIEGTGIPVTISTDNGLILFRILKEIFVSISMHGILLSVSASCKGENLIFDIQYQGEQPDLDSHSQDDHNAELTIKQRIELIGGKLEMKESLTGQSNHEINIHLKNCSNE